MKPDVIIFDLFGTLVRFGVQHHPYRQLLKWARENGRRPLVDDARTIMTIDGEIAQLAHYMGIHPPAEFLRKLNADIENELVSLKLFDDVAPTLNALQKNNIQFAICSNLAKPYGAVIERLLSQYAFTSFLSYECGFIKPEPEIYHRAADSIKVATADCLFIGDSYLADVWGPQQVGMKSIYLCRSEITVQNSVSNLYEVLNTHW